MMLLSLVGFFLFKAANWLLIQDTQKRGEKRVGYI